MSSFFRILLFFLLQGSVICLVSDTSSSPTYNYFAIGSNMALSTMTALRNLQPLAYTPAMLPNHRLAFNIPGTPFLEPSWASVEPIVSDNINDDDKKEQHNLVHGVLYKLTERDFASICRTEGVPFSYQLHRCRVIPYAGDGGDAGRNVLLSNNYKSVPAFTLRASRPEWQSSRDIPPSRSYLNVLIRGAKEFRFDEDYVRTLEEMEAGKTIGNGVAEGMLSFAELSKSIRGE